MIFKKGGIDKTLIFRRGIGEKEGRPFWSSSCNFYLKKVDKQKCFSVITKNSNWEILTKNLVTVLLKDKMGLAMKNFNNTGVH